MGKAYLLLLLLSAAAASAQRMPDEVLLTNGKIWTVNPAQSEAEAVLIRGNRIVAVGTTVELLQLKRPTTVVVDLQGKRVLPGFNDAHVHFYSGGANLTGVQLRFSKSEAEFRDTLAAFAANRPKKRWITGGNWDHENWSGANLPTRQLIDGVTPDQPVFISRLDGHMALANSVALRLAGVDRKTKDVAGGMIVRDATGNPTGVLKDAAMDLVTRVIPEPTEDQIVTAIRAAQTYAAANGVTSVQDMSASPEVLHAYEAMLALGQLRVRVSGHQPLPTWKRQAAVRIRAHFGNDFLRIGGLKGFADGSLGSTTALLFGPYLDAPNTAGIASDELSQPTQMYKDVKAADEAGLQVAIHAIGDKANSLILDMYERAESENGSRDRRFRIEHAQHLRVQDISRFSRLSVIASMQPIHLADDGRWAEKRIGPERAKTSYAFRTLLDSGATLAFGSDWDVAPMKPLLGIYAAVTRRTVDGKHPDGWIPEQRITVQEAIKAFTIGSAYASFDEKVKGSIEPGKLADLVVLSDDILTIDPTKIPDVKIVLTMLDGKAVSSDLAAPFKLPSGLKLRSDALDVPSWPN